MKKFRYPLQPILTQHEWEISALKNELLNLNRALHAEEEALARLLAAMQVTEQEIVALCRDHEVIPRERKAVAELYLLDQRRQAKRKQAEVEHSRELVGRVARQLTEKRQSQRSIEKHRERQSERFTAELMRQEAHESDQLWLAKLAGQR